MSRLWIASLCLALAGCIGPLVPVVKLDPDSAMQLRREVALYDSLDLNARSVRNLGAIDAISCMNKLYDRAPSREDAVDQLRYKASSLGGNGITRLVCETQEGTNLAKNCWSSVTCHAVAVAVGSADGLPPVSEGRAGPSPADQPPRSAPPGQQGPATRSPSSGTGFAVAPGGYALTNHHVIVGCTDITAAAHGSRGKARVVRTDPTNDLAILKVSDLTAEPLPLREAPRLRAGETIVAVGFPLQGLLAREPHVTVGSVSALAGIRDDSRFIQVSAPVQAGNSGGPVLDESGNVVGIVTSKLNAVRVAAATGDVPQNVNFALNIQTAKTLLDASAIQYTTATSSTHLNAADIGERAKAAVIYLECRQ